MARGRRGPHTDRTRQSDIKIDVRLPVVIASRPLATLLEALNRARAALECADARAPVAARPARVLDRPTRFNRTVHLCARIDASPGCRDIKRQLQHCRLSDKLVSVTRCIVLYLVGIRSEVVLFSLP